MGLGYSSRAHHAANEGATEVKARPGKYVNPQDLEEAKAIMWNDLMNHARTVAHDRIERVRVVGVMDRHNRWTYTIVCASWCPCRRDGS